VEEKLKVALSNYAWRLLLKQLVTEYETKVEEKGRKAGG
jgi:hypothetical protein